MTTAQIDFLLNGARVSIANPNPTMMLLDYLREQRRLTGTKEGCREGDCGACTVVIARLRADMLEIRAVNACILFLPAIDGTAIFTVEGAARSAGSLHPVQRAMIDLHGSQCGFCTPGFIMSMVAADLAGERPVRPRIDELLAGNLCRCTGYGPIVAAAEASIGRGSNNDHILTDLADRIRALRRATMLKIAHASDDHRTILSYCAPRSLAELQSALSEAPTATLLAGGTDVGLWVTKQHRVLSNIIDVSKVEELQQIEEAEDAVLIGAGVTYTDARAALARLRPELNRFISRIASEQIRNSGTIGGNIANGSPIGDMPPVLIALGARLELIGSAGSRWIALESFFLDYGKQDRQVGETVARIVIPKTAAQTRFAAYKISKRFDQDISSVSAAFHAVVTDGIAHDVRLCFGGMAGIPKRAACAENALEGHRLDEARIAKAAAALVQDFSPLDDHRASARYRLLVAQNLIRKFGLEVTGARLVSLDREPVA